MARITAAPAISSKLSYFRFPSTKYLKFSDRTGVQRRRVYDLDLLYPSELDSHLGQDELSFSRARKLSSPPSLCKLLARRLAAATAPTSRSMWWCAVAGESLSVHRATYPRRESAARNESPRRACSPHFIRRGLPGARGDDALCGGKIYPMMPETAIQDVDAVSDPGGEQQTLDARGGNQDQHGSRNR